MSDARDALGVTIKVLTAQAFALDRIFFRAAKGAVSGNPHSLYDARKALTAQARCRATFKILLALQAAGGACHAEARSSREGGDAQKFPNSSERTIQVPKTPCEDNGLPQEAPFAPAPISSPAPAPGRRLVRRTSGGSASWTPERRARQAAAIRTWQPWRKSAGPRTQDGKTRSAKNALKHGYRSRPYIESRREDRRILKRSTHNLAAAKRLLGTVSGQCNRLNGLHLALRLSPNWYWPTDLRADTVSPRKFSGNRGPGGTSRRQTLANAPRRRWRIAS